MSQTHTESSSSPVSRPATPRDVAATRPGWLTRVAGNSLSKIGRKGLMSALGQLKYGLLTLEEGGEVHQFGHATADGLAAKVTVHDPCFWTELLAHGTIGAGESFRQGWWSTDDLTMVVRILVRNRSVMQGLEGGLAALAAPLRKAAHWSNRNTVDGSRKNIEAHYDLSNEFFAAPLARPDTTEPPRRACDECLAQIRQFGLAAQSVNAEIAWRFEHPGNSHSVFKGLFLIIHIRAVRNNQWRSCFVDQHAVSFIHDSEAKSPE